MSKKLFNQCLQIAKNNMELRIINGKVYLEYSSGKIKQINLTGYVFK